MVFNITECMKFSAQGYFSKTGRRKCIHLDKGMFGGYVCKLGHQIDTIPRISSSITPCKDKEIARSA
jgi:hypothetical protein